MSTREFQAVRNWGTFSSASHRKWLCVPSAKPHSHLCLSIRDDYEVAIKIHHYTHSNEAPCSRLSETIFWELFSTL